MTMEQMLLRLEQVSGPNKSGEYTAKCPAHEDRTASLKLKQHVGKDGIERIYFCCHAGCTKDEVLRALGIEADELVVKPREEDEEMRHRKQERKTEADAVDPRGTWIIYNRGQALEFAECSECGHEQEPNIVLMCTTYPNKCPACKAIMGVRTIAEHVDEGTWIPESCKGK